MKLLKVGAALAGLALAFAASAANAIIYDLNQNNIGGGVTKYGEVNVTQNGLGLNFVVTLIPGVTFHTGGSHTSFAFDLVGTPSVTFSNVTGLGAGFTTGGPGSFPNSPFGAFEYGLNCNCGQGNDPPVPGPLSFTIMPTNGVTLLTLEAGTDGIMGAADLQAAGIGGATGAIGWGGTTSVPEPATWAMLIMGFGMVGAGMRMRRRGALLA